MNVRTVLVCACLALIPASAVGQSKSSVCAGPPSPERTACLKSEVARGRRELQTIERQNRNLDRAKAATCFARSGGAHAAGVAGAAAASGGGTAGVLAGKVAGHATYGALTSAADKALGNSHACTKRAH